MIKRLTFVEDFRCFKQDESIDFHSGVNLLVGDQGVGKSTIFQCLAAVAGTKSKAITRGTKDKVKVDVEGGQYDVLALDFEKDSRRTQGYFDDSNAGFNFQVITMFKSHGESTKYLLEVLSTKKGTIFLIDEPDMALSIRSIKQLAHDLKIAAENGCQLIVAVHNPFLILSFEEVLDVAKRQFVDSGDFVRELWGDSIEILAKWHVHQ